MSAKAPPKHAPESIGDRIRNWRRRRNGMSQATLAGLAGISQGYLSQIETGRRPLDRRSTQVAIASALNISVPQLLGQPSDNGDPQRSQATAYIPAIRSAIVELSHGERRAPQRDPDTLRGALVDTMDLRNAAKLGVLAATLPQLLHDVAGHNGAMAPEFIEALFCAQVGLKNMGYRDLSREVASLGLKVAEAHDDPAWLGQARFAAALAVPLENASLGAKLATSAADELQRVPGRRAQEVYGGLHLMSALHAATAVRPDEAMAHLAEAEGVARALGEPDQYGELSAGVAGNWFGPTNVDYWRTAVAAELKDAGAAVAVADRIQIGAVPIPSRHVYYWTDFARALAADGLVLEAMRALARAERAAPLHFRFNPIVPNLVKALVGQARRKADAEEIRELARKLGIHPI